jgi:uncharacterized protein (DUF362 family)
MLHRLRSDEGGANNVMTGRRVLLCPNLNIACSTLCKHLCTTNGKLVVHVNRVDVDVDGDVLIVYI